MLTKAEIEKIVEMRKNRVTCKEIGKIFNREESTIRRACIRHGVDGDIRKHRVDSIIKCIKQGMTARETANHLGVSRVTVKNTAHLHGLELKRERKQKVFKKERVPTVCKERTVDEKKLKALEALKALGLS